MKKRMTMLDSGFIRMERHEAPQHGSVLIVFRIPDGAPPDYLHQLAARMRQAPVTGQRFNWVLSKGLAGKVVPSWTVLPPEDIEIDYHFRHSALPQPGGELELGLLVSRLVAHQIDLTRPPWELHLIEGLQDGRFALFMKMHHSLLDGVTALRMLKNWLSEDPLQSDAPPLWADEMPPRPKLAERLGLPGRSKSGLDRVRDSANATLSSLSEIGRALGTTVAAARGSGDGLVAPYTAPRTVFNHRITQRRRVSTQTIELERIKKVAAQIDGTVNDAIAVVFAGALRRYLVEIDQLPDRALVAGLLASLRTTVDEKTAAEAGNLISFIFADLATDTDDIGLRAARVTKSTRAGKDHLLGLKGNAMAYSSLMLAPFILTAVTGTGHHLPMFNVALSNVPGVDVPLYWNGAQAEAVHATTIIANGQSLVVTVTSWNGRLCFTFTACPDSAPHPQRLSVYLADALEEVEHALSAGPIR